MVLESRGRKYFVRAAARYRRSKLGCIGTSGHAVALIRVDAPGAAENNLRAKARQLNASQPHNHIIMGSLFEQPRNAGTLCKTGT